MEVPYTGCSPRELLLARQGPVEDNYRRIPVPAFAVFPMRRKVKRPASLALPLFVKSLTEDGSRGISQASVVHTDEKLAERVAFVHEQIGTAAIAEQYIEGRELYVGVLGNTRLRVLPVWELKFGNIAPGALPIATEKVKHDLKYQKRAGILDGPAEDLAHELRSRIQRLAKRAPSIGAYDMRAQTFGSLPTEFHISSKRIPTPKLRKAKSSRRQLSMTASRTPTCCIAFWHSE
jgi:D-alanine-D-alanine ligase